MQSARTALFLAVFAIGACVGQPPADPSEDAGSGGTGSGSGNGGALGGGGDGGTDADGGGSDVGKAQADGGRSALDAGAGAEDGGLVIGCHDAADCSIGDVCCGRKKDDDNTVYKSVSCESTCDSPYVYDHSVFCDPNDPHSCDGVVVNPHCEPSDILPGMFVCQ